MQLLLRIVCWAIAFYFFIISNIGYNFPPDLSGPAGKALLVSIVLFLLPFAKSLSITGLFSYEAKIDEVKKEVSDFKTETRDLIKIQTSLITSVSANQTTHNVFNIPSLTDAANAEKQIPHRAQNPNSTETAERVKHVVSVGPLELNIELARTRMDLERLLREKVGRTTGLGGKREVKFMSLTGLWREYIQDNPQMKHYDSAMRYVVDICNAAIHGQNVPIENAVEAIQLGDEIKSALTEGLTQA